MITKLLAAWALMALCVVIHAGGISSAVAWLRRKSISRTFWPMNWLFIRIAGWVVLLHLLEIVAWGVFYAWKDAVPDLTSALYFSAVTYTTTGYGDIVLPEQWRLVGGVEALTGILMCGFSTGFFFAMVSKMSEESRAAGAWRSER